jgi:hypothetical protein
MNRESQTIHGNSHDLQPLRYIFTICIEKLMNRIESYDSNRDSYDFNIIDQKQFILFYTHTNPPAPALSTIVASAVFISSLYRYHNPSLYVLVPSIRFVPFS